MAILGGTTFQLAGGVNLAPLSPSTMGTGLVDSCPKTKERGIQQPTKTRAKARNIERMVSTVLHTWKQLLGNRLLAKESI
jgi:hypothetical protein